jgi:hypothetical protein
MVLCLTQPLNRYEYEEFSWVQSAVDEKADLTAIREPIVYKMCEPGSLAACSFFPYTTYLHMSNTTDLTPTS